MRSTLRSKQLVSELLWTKQSVLAALTYRDTAALLRLHVVDSDAVRSDERVAAIVAEAQRRRVTVLHARSRQQLANMLPRGSPNDRVPQNVLLECLPRQSTPLWLPEHVAAILARHRAPSPALAVFLSGVTDPHNVASVARAAVFFGCSDVLLSEHGNAPLSEVVSVASAGASEAVHFHAIHPRDLVTLPNVRVWAAVVPDSSARAVRVRDLRSIVASAPRDTLNVLAFGSEGKGLGPRFVDSEGVTPFFIPGEPASPLLDSLNVGVSVAVTLSHVRQ
jgi:tRNA G18 (ribose-2'-O)-methylase SpoU